MRKDYKTHISEKKKKTVDEFSKLIKEYPIIGVLNLESLPSQQLNAMRDKLRNNDVLIKMTKKKFIKLAIENAKKDKKSIEQLEEYLKGMPAMLFTKQNPFSLFKLLKKNKSKAPAKAGQTAPSDIKVDAGPTSFQPGPIISELAAFGIKTKVDNGKLNITEDTTIAKEGDEIDEKLASMLLRLGIEPMEIGLDLMAIYENGTVFTKKILDIDEEAFLADIENSARWAFNLSVEAGYPTKDNITCLITKAYSNSKGLADEAEIINSETITGIICKAQTQMLSVKAASGIDA